MIITLSTLGTIFDLLMSQLSKNLFNDLPCFVSFGVYVIIKVEVRPYAFC